MRAIHALTFVALVGLTAGAMPSCSNFNDCVHKKTCEPSPGSDAGTPDTGGNGGTAGVLANSGGTAGSSGGSGGNGADNAGSAGAAPCDGACGGVTSACDTTTNTCVECVTGEDCKAPGPACDVATNTCVECLEKQDCGGAKPACDVATNTCVECVASTDCKDSAKPLCDTTANHCVACLKQADCTAATASACNAGVCSACSKDEECSTISGMGVCDAGTCVQCTVAKESVCSGNSCDPAAKQCTAIPLGTVNYCQPCSADSECIGGNQPDPDARCVPMKFMGVSRAGGFCLRRAAKACSKPLTVQFSAPSLTGATAEPYCALDQDSTRCEAVVDMVASAPCNDSKDSSCGCARDKNGNCAEVGQGGLCRTVGGNANLCTIPCALANQCPGTLTCPGGAKPYCQ